MPRLYLNFLAFTRGPCFPIGFLIVCGFRQFLLCGSVVADDKFLAFSCSSSIVCRYPACSSLCAAVFAFVPYIKKNNCTPWSPSYNGLPHFSYAIEIFGINLYGKSLMLHTTEKDVIQSLY